MYRNQYQVNPGLYCVGNPSSDDPVFVTANYKLSLDALRKELTGINSWILVIDTRGINVWCAAGKKTFTAEEVGYQVKKEQLDQLVSHRELILPQLAANGVAARDIKKLCGFKGRFGPILGLICPIYLILGAKPRSWSSLLSKKHLFWRPIWSVLSQAWKREDEIWNRCGFGSAYCQKNTQMVWISTLPPSSLGFGR